MGIKTVKLKFEVFKTLNLLLCFTEISILKVLALIQRSCSLLDETFYSHFPNFAGSLCTGRSVIFALLSVLFPFPWHVLFLQPSKRVIFFVTISGHSGWQDHQGKMIFVPAVLRVWLRLSVSLEKAHSCEVLENSCSANTDFRRTGDILGHF